MQLAFDNWSGIALHSEKAAEIRKCSAVTSIYPRVKALEVICTQTSIKTVLEHIRGRKRLLDTEALVMIFGEAFVTEQGLQEDPTIKILPAAVDKEIIIAAKPDVSPLKDITDRAEIIFIDEEIAAPIKTMPAASGNKKVTSGFSNSNIKTLSLIGCEYFDFADPGRGVHSYINRAVFFLRADTHIGPCYGRCSKSGTVRIYATVH